MKRKSLLFFLLIALLAPLAMMGQEATRANRLMQFEPASGLLQMNGTHGTTNRGGDRATTYEKVTSAQSDWSGNYVLAIANGETTAYAFNGSVSTSNDYGYYTGGFTSVTRSDNTITDAGSAAVLTLAPVTYQGSTYYTIQINGGNYLGSYSSGLVSSASISSNTTRYYWNVSYDSESSSVILYSLSDGSDDYSIAFYIMSYNSNSYGGYTTYGLSYSGATFNYYYCTLYKDPTSGGGQGGDEYVWVETTTITPNEEYLIGFQYGNNVYLAVNYRTGQSGNNCYYTSSNSSYYGYTALATIDGDGHVTGVSGYATDLQYCTWKFSTSSGGYIQSGYQSNRYLYGWTSSSYYDLYPNTTSQSWTYSSSNGTLSNGNCYAGYYALNSNNHMRVTASTPSSTVKLYTKQLVETGYAVNAASTISNGSIQFSINGGYDWYDNLSNVPAGETVVISVQPETGYVSGTPTVTPASGTAPTVSGSGNNYSFVMPESDVTVNVTFNCTTPADPTFSVAGGTYTSVQNVSISCATAGATIYYTTDGSTPTNSSTQYTGAITINSTTTLKAIAYIGTCTSNVTTATYTMNLPTYTVTCATGLTGGSITANPMTAVEGTTITITATPESGYFLGTITATDASNNNVAVTVNGNEGTFTMPASNVTVTATFTQGFHVTLNQTPNGTISADQTTNLQPGDIVTLTATPDNGCVFLAWYAYKTGNPRDVIAVISNTTILMPASDVTVQAVFVTEEEHEQIVGGGSNTDGNLPTNVYMKYSLTQQIYTAAEIGYNGRITAIAFKANGAATRNLEVYMTHTDLTAFSSTTGWEVMGSVAKVFSGSVSFTSGDWTTITLDTPFEYDGTSNLNICVADRTGSWVTNITFNTYSTFANRALYINDDNTDYGAGVGYSNQLEGYSGTHLTYNNQIKFTIKTPGSAESLTVSPDVINDFSYVEGQGPSQTHKLDIVGVDLENNISLTAPTNFEICLTEDGTYESSLTIPRETSKRGRGVTTWDFEDGLQGWTAVDADGDGYNWAHNTSFGGHNNSTGIVYSQSYDNNAGTLYPDNWLISPQVELGGSFSMWAHPQQAAYPAEHFGIYVSTTNTDISSFTLLDEWTLNSGDWKQFSVDLRLYTGQTGYIAVRHFNGMDQFYINVDDFVLDTDATITVEMPVTITPATVFVRMKDNLNRGSYNGTLTASAGTGDNLNCSVSLSGEVIAPSYTVTLATNITEGGGVLGAGTYTDGTSVTVSAIANSPYQFINWTENGTEVSTNASYTFTVDGSDRTLVANFGFIKHIDKYSASSNGWYLIASPIGDVPIENVTNLNANQFDLYYFDQTQQPYEWINYYQGSDLNFNSLQKGKGYLYANSGDVDLVFNGTAYNQSGDVTLVYSEENSDSNMWGWNLIGNPFAEEATIVDWEYMRMNDEHNEIILYDGLHSPAVAPMEGIFVHATKTGSKTVTFTKSSKGNTTTNGDRIMINISQDQKVIDRAAVRFGEGQELPKYQLNQNSTKVYIPMDGEDFAVVRSEGVGELPVNFKAQENGNYTLSLNTEMNFGYLHLVDNMTGNDIDMLANPSYSFEARTTDYSQRFKLVFATGDNANDNFAYFSNGSFVINNEGNATLQVIDITGRILKSESINGCANVNVNAAPGIYMIRLINGDNVKVQKVVVK